MKLEAGRTYYYVPKDTRWHRPAKVTVAKVGRKWATLSREDGTQMHQKVSLEPLNGQYQVIEQGFGTSGFLFADELDYGVDLYRKAVHQALRTILGFSSEVSLDDLKKVVELLRIEVELPEPLKKPTPYDVVPRLIEIRDRRDNTKLVSSAIGKIHDSEYDQAISDLSLYSTKLEEEGFSDWSAEIDDIISAIENTLPV